MREIRLSGSMSGDWKRGSIKDLPRQSSTLNGVPNQIRARVTAMFRAMFREPAVVLLYRGPFRNCETLTQTR